MAANPETAAPFKGRMLDVVNKIHSAPTVRDILVGLKDEIQSLFDAERMTIFALDTQAQQLYSITAVGGELKEIRVPKSFTSIAGFTGLSRQTLNIKDAYDATELQRIHAKLAFDPRWDRQTGFRTKQVLSVPITFEKFLLGVVQLVNRKGGGTFTPEEVAGLEEVARTLGIAFYNQRRVATTSKPSKYAYLVAKGVIAEKDLEAAAADARVRNCSVEKVLMERHAVPKQELLRSLSQFYSVPSFDYDGTQAIPQDLKERFSADFLRKYSCVPFGKTGREALVAVADPHDLTRIDAVKATNVAPKLDVYVATLEDIKSMIDAAYGAETEPREDLGDPDSDDLVAEEIDEGAEGTGVDEQDSGVVKLANQIIRDAYKSGASDIHVEPYGDKMPMMVRFRTDGECKVYQQVPAELRNALVSRLKIMARLDISEKRKPQDGKIRFRSKKGTIELRVATIPTSGGNEDVVMRILAGSEPIPLSKMSFSDRNLKAWRKLLDSPYGICLVVGPTGSGKTTTLHSALGAINTPDMKIWTAEDPVEITQHGLRQVQVQPKIGLTFAAAMRSFLRADPDVIMVGEMRDQETAQTAIEASLTGHIVFSTLHTNSAAETITRLLDMDIDPFSFADALLGIMAQRLVRTPCSKCKETYHPEPEEFQELAEAAGPGVLEARGIKYTADTKLVKPKGCPDCAGSGYRGRMGIHELLLNSPAIKELIHHRAPVSQIHEVAVKEGMETLMQDGIVKCFQGSTTFPQVRSVCMR